MARALRVIGMTTTEHRKPFGDKCKDVDGETWYRQGDTDTWSLEPNGIPGVPNPRGDQMVNWGPFTEA